MTTANHTNSSVDEPGRNAQGQYLPTDEEERFWSKVDRSGGRNACWPWLAGRDKDGYGKFWMKSGRTIRAHRYAIKLFKPGNAKDDVGKHTCDHAWCCNPKHINHGTQAQNQAEKVQRGRSLRGAKHPQARINEATALKIKKLYRSGVRLKDIAARFEITQGHACQVVFTSWKHLDAQVANGR